jgi:hypothetical protein
MLFDVDGSPYGIPFHPFILALTFPFKFDSHHIALIPCQTFMISEIMATGASQQQLEADVRLCCIIQVKMWPVENKVHKI